VKSDEVTVHRRSRDPCYGSRNLVNQIIVH